MDIVRIINIYVILMGICIFFIYIGLKILKRDPEYRVNLLFTCFFFSVSIGLISNFIYVLITDPLLQDLVNFLNILTIFFVCLGLGFLLLAIINLDGSKNISTRCLIIFIIVDSLICSVLFFIPNGAEVKIVKHGIQLSPVWSLQFMATALTIILTSLTLTWIFTIKLYKKFNNRIFIKKLRMFVLGISLFYHYAILTCITNHLNTSLLRLIYLLTSPFAILGAILVYYGISLSPKQDLS